MSRTDGFANAGNRFAGFEVMALVHRTERSMVLRCKADTGPALVKFLRVELPGASDIARFRREFELSRKMTHPHIVSAEQLGSHDGVMYMVMPDDGAVAVRELLRSGLMPVAAAVRIMLAVVQALQTVHGLHVVHKDISPGNIVVDLPRDIIKLIDFGIAAEISSERPELARPEDLEGTLAYMAPEQTGRMNRDVDYRADFYALGATLYEMLVGMPPFVCNDAVEHVHAHLTRSAVPLHELRPEVPVALSDLVARLLSKEPESRYQSHHALLQDLKAVDAWLANPDPANPPVLSAADLAERFAVSGRLYGRQNESAAIVQAFEAAAIGTARLVTIAGFSGIGKTALVNEVQRAMLGFRGNFVSGKFNQFGQHAPYGAFTAALQQRARQILALAESQQAAWCAALDQALGGNVALVADAVPDLARLLGDRPAVMALGPAEAENRFLRSMRLALGALASAAEPLVLFIDDLQWADRASRRLLRELALDASLQHVLLIGAYRSNEVPPDHPLAQDLADYAKLGERFLALSVGPLLVDDTVALLADSLHCDAVEVAELAQLCQLKTGGNPYFLRRFLEDLQHRDLIWLDREAGRWRWSVAQIGAEKIADNVVELTVAQLQRLPENTVRVLTTASCLGARFELQMLATATDMAQEAALAALEPALAASVVAPSDGSYKWVGVLDASERAGLCVGFAFAHDRVQEAAYSLATAAQRPALHLRIGRLLLSDMDLARPAFAVVNHLNAGASLITDPAERRQLAHLNARAASLARDAAAFDLAASYAQLAIDCFGPAYWTEDPQAALALYVQAARMAYLGGRADQMEALIETALAHASNAAEQALLMDVRIESFYASGKLADTLDLGLAALKLLEVAPPQVASQMEAVQLVATIKAEIEAIGVAALAERAPMSDPLRLQQMTVIAKMTAAAYIARPALLPLLTVLQMRLMIDHGHAPMALSGYSVMGLMSAEFLRDYRFGYELGRMSLELIERHGWRQVYAHAAFSFNTFLRHWVEPVRNGLAGSMEVHHNGQEYGNLRHAGLALYMHDYHAFLDGKPLSELQELIALHSETLARIRQPVAQDYLSVLQEAVLELQDAQPMATPLESARFSAQRRREVYAARNDQTGMMFLEAFACVLYGLCDRPREALAAGQAASALFTAARGMYMVPFCVFYTGISALRLTAGQTAEEATAGREAGVAALARFDLWNQTSSDLAPLRNLLAAELAHLDGQSAVAHALLDQAVTQSERLDNLLIAGLARWHRGRLLGADEAGLADLAEAHTLLLRWGGRAAATALVAATPGLSRRGNTAQRASRPASLQNTVNSTMHTTGSNLLDLTTLMKAVRAITAEIELAPLLRHMLHVLRENAGAQRAAIVLQGEDGWSLQADGDAQGQLQVQQNLPIEQAGQQLPLEVVRTVLNTASPVLIFDLAAEPQWARLSYFMRQGGKSVLCMPLVKQGQTVGALYLENAATTGAFSPGRIEFLELLSGNVVNAIDNARLYAELRGLANTLEQRVTDRTRELRNSEARVKTILQNAPLPMTVTRRTDAVIAYANAHAANFLGRSVGSLVGSRAPAHYRNPHDRDRIAELLLRDGAVNDEEVCLIAADGSDRWALMSLVPIDYDGEACDLVVVVDITERKTMEEELRRMATTDVLTGAANRRHFIAQSEAELVRARRHDQPMGLIMLDIDHFKQFNDQHGHATGDLVLREVVACCAALVRQQDLVGRLGGEEFVVLLPQTDIAAAHTLAERLRLGIAALELTSEHGKPLSVTASFGVSELVMGDDVDSLLARVDAALYEAKRGGRNQVRRG
jgi:diguanylate cyclase (GGDEF)-like protein/PAS domain S-box-containing protein